MSELFARLLPAAREVRTPLAVGFTWFAILWLFFAALEGDESTVAKLFSDAFGEVPEIGLFSAVAFSAAVVGSGIVRLMDRIMQLQRRESDRHYNPLDRPEPFRLVMRVAAATKAEEVAPSRFQQSNSSIAATDLTYCEHLEIYLVAAKNMGLDSGWRQDANGRARDMRIYREYLRQETNFGALESEQLLRYSLLYPIGFGVFASGMWAYGSRPELSPFALCIGLVLLFVVVLLDYRRTGALLIGHWRKLVHSFPDWLPADVQDRRKSETLNSEPSVDES